MWERCYWNHSLFFYLTVPPTPPKKAGPSTKRSSVCGLSNLSENHQSTIYNSSATDIFRHSIQKRVQPSIQPILTLLLQRLAMSNARPVWPEDKASHKHCAPAMPSSPDLQAKKGMSCVMLKHVLRSLVLSYQKKAWLSYIKRKLAWHQPSQGSLSYSSAKPSFSMTTNYKK